VTTTIAGVTGTAPSTWSASATEASVAADASVAALASAGWSASLPSDVWTSLLPAASAGLSDLAAAPVLSVAALPSPALADWPLCLPSLAELSSFDFAR
jgi:hypothetical protein